MNYAGFDYSNKTAQEVFDFVAKHLLTQNRKSSDSCGSCYYRAVKTDGTILMCAGGCLIPDALYEFSMEGRGWNNVINGFYRSSLHSDLITKLQILHDNNEPYNWPNKLAELAVETGLTFSPPTAGEVHVQSK